ncbi:SGNH/GDSL hydrolase family protein [Nocardioides lentus]|uniref:SGNH/GDSL hydrolase family protein n=1 Tax=Nocardioides lentus TaxID=338077 RepID=A0ABP5A9M2_9ACTN
MPRRTVVASALAAVLLVAGCSSSGDQTEPTDAGSTAAAGRAEPPLRYVALGDSYTAAPLVPSIDGASGPCVRSTGNYPALVAEALAAEGRDVRLTDRSCVEAATADLFAPQTLDGPTLTGEAGPAQTVPAQTAPLDRRTDLVTVGIGGNDVLTPLVGTCPALRDADPTGSPCAASLGAQPEERLAELRVTLAQALRRVQREAPRAQVLLVGYPHTAPATGTCPDRLPLADGDVAFVRGVADGLDATMRTAAQDAGVRFVDAYAASVGHDICSGDPWVNGATTDPGAALAFHPFAAGQEAVADLVTEAVRPAGRPTGNG